MDITLEIVENLKIKDRRAGEVLGWCPSCGCDDANYNIAKGVWRCWHCNSKGRITDVETTVPAGVHLDFEEETKDIPKIRELYESFVSSCVSTLGKCPNVYSYLKSRGLKEETINDFRLGFCSTAFYEEYSNLVAEDAGIIIGDYALLTNRITIPYTYKDEVVDVRGRTVDSVFTYKEGIPKYISLRGGYKPRGATYLFNHDIIKDSSEVVITEGEFKALVAIQEGFPVVATPGVHHWMDSWSEELRDKTVILAADNEIVEGRRTPAYIQAKALSKSLPNLKVAILYRNANQKKVDLDSYIVSGLSFERALKGAIPVDEFLKQEERKGYGRRRKV